MVHVAVGDQDKFHHFSLDFLDNFLSFGRGVDNNSFPGFSAGDNITVILKDRLPVVLVHFS
jgi:hypothetical protein